MDHILTAWTGLGIIVALGVVASARSALRATTLVVAWRWAVAASLFWLIVIAARGADLVPPEFGDLLWDCVALLSLCPAVAVLGARRPGVGAWTWFVILPMLAVLGWPMLTVWGSDWRPQSFQWDVPQLVGFVLVLLMGAGNYVGTRFWASACLSGVSLCLLVAPLSAVAPAWPSADTSRCLAGLAMGAAAINAFVQGQRRQVATTALDGLWDDYRNFFGIVWSRRLQDRLNAVAALQNWPVRVTLEGFAWSEPLTDSQRQEAEAKVEQSLRWMLRRFVDPEWIDARLTSITRESPREQGEDSA